MMQANSAFTTASTITVRDLQYPSVTDNNLNLAVIFDPSTHPSYLIQAYEEQPFVHRDQGMQVRCIWHEKNIHASDWMYFTWTEACPGPDSPVAVSVADPWSPALVSYEFNQFAAITILILCKMIA
jgi:hypothetical protein